MERFEEITKLLFVKLFDENNLSSNHSIFNNPSLRNYSSLNNLYKKAINQLAIIALTANALKSDRQLCLAAGMNDYLSKPISLMELMASIEKWL